MKEAEKILDAFISYTESSYFSHKRALPFIKWAGGKRSIISELLKFVPTSFNDYYEPFLGGGAVFFNLSDKIKKAWLSDVNAELVLAYKMIQDNPDALIQSLEAHKRKHEEQDYYYKIRGKYISKDSIETASRFIYLNKTCFNGLYRVNKSGKFNVPRGSYKNPLICDIDNIMLAHKTLEKAVLKKYSFEKIDPKEGDFIYCDPPYDDTFSNYSASGFGKEEQEKLRNYVDKWSKMGCHVMISNSDTDFIRKLYSKYYIYEIQAPRNINCKVEGRKPLTELIIVSYQCQN